MQEKDRITVEIYKAQKIAGERFYYHKGFCQSQPRRSVFSGISAYAQRFVNFFARRPEMHSHTPYYVKYVRHLSELAPTNGYQNAYVQFFKVQDFKKQVACRTIISLCLVAYQRSAGTLPRTKN